MTDNGWISIPVVTNSPVISTTLEYQIGDDVYVKALRRLRSPDALVFDARTVLNMPYIGRHRAP